MKIQFLFAATAIALMGYTGTTQANEPKPSQPYFLNSQDFLDSKEVSQNIINQSSLDQGISFREAWIIEKSVSLCLGFGFEKTYPNAEFAKCVQDEFHQEKSNSNPYIIPSSGYNLQSSGYFHRGRNVVTPRGPRTLGRSISSSLPQNLSPVSVMSQSTIRELRTVGDFHISGELTTGNGLRVNELGRKE